MTTPTIHLNGTNGADLLSQTVDAMLALSGAINALMAAAPHGRDYYVQTTIRAEWFGDGTPATCTCGRSPDCDHVRHAQTYAKALGSVGATWSEIR